MAKLCPLRISLRIKIEVALVNREYLMSMLIIRQEEEPGRHMSGLPGGIPTGLRLSKASQTTDGGISLSIS